ncbi:ABC-2 type transport system ATP-binding protein [Spinactinospora alkalitolerans]|uniref:ABC-2 type transport system ATP-binding protein n=1 Tax=Spinactinospora alkalitolerans TaxID=687207 RepID=A0A852TYE7_9ACTN|nr:ABC transporter ATP-binding protein [Spinactinospora alkalitolerans]NYE47024.1 ABC-2 type transport system ATP-binding protein [Spinactinospora alkalitolerans]
MPDDSDELLVRTTDLSKRYGGAAAVDRLDLTVRRGEIFGFLGPNGAGKTTTLRMLLGLIRPSSGTARVLGRPPGHPAALRAIGALIEGPAFYPYLSGRDNLRLVARYAGIRAGRTDAALETVGLAGRGGDAFATYSLGMKQRLGVAAALLKDPELVILDEPTNGLDPGGMRDMRGLIRDLADWGHTVLLSSHLMAEVEQLCDRVAVISGGRLVAEGDVTELRGESVLRVRADPLDRARELLERLVGPDRVALDGGGLRLRTDPAGAGPLNKELVGAGITVTELCREKRTLEDAFFEVTGTGGGNR